MTRGWIQARTSGASRETELVCDALTHPRTLANDFTGLVEGFRQALHPQPKKYWGLLKPMILVHLIPEMDGGYTDAELRFFREAAYEASKSTHIFLATSEYGPLSDQQLEAVIDVL